MLLRELPGMVREPVPPASMVTSALMLLALYMSTGAFPPLLRAIILLAPAAAYPAPVPGDVGKQVGLRRIGNNGETGNVSFWVAAPLGLEGMDRGHFGIVSASLWHRGRWGGLESVIACKAAFSKRVLGARRGDADEARPSTHRRRRRILETHCRGDAVMVDLGSHVGYFTMLAAAHGCATRSAELDAGFVSLVRLALDANGFDHGRHRVFEGAVPAEHSLDSVTEGDGDILFAKVDLEGYEAAIIGVDATRLGG